MALSIIQLQQLIKNVFLTHQCPAVRAIIVAMMKIFTGVFGQHIKMHKTEVFLTAELEIIENFATGKFHA